MPKPIIIQKKIYIERVPLFQTTTTLAGQATPSTARAIQFTPIHIRSKSTHYLYSITPGFGMCNKQILNRHFSEK